MLEALFALLSGGGGIAAAIAAIIAAIGAAYLKGKSVQKTKQKAKEADAYERHLEDIADANTARGRVDPHKLPDNDPYRRD